MRNLLHCYKITGPIFHQNKWKRSDSIRCKVKHKFAHGRHFNTLDNISKYILPQNTDFGNMIHKTTITNHT